MNKPIDRATLFADTIPATTTAPNLGGISPMSDGETAEISAVLPNVEIPTGSADVLIRTSATAPKVDPAAVALVERIAAEAIAAAQPADQFKWDADSPEVVVPCQPMTACYVNPFGAVVIRQEADYPEDDPFVFFRPENLTALIAKLETFLPAPAAQRRARA